MKDTYLVIDADCIRVHLLLLLKLYVVIVSLSDVVDSSCYPSITNLQINMTYSVVWKRMYPY